MAVVLLQVEKGNEQQGRQEVEMLYERDINEGMKVVIDGDGRLQKAEDRS